MDSENAEVRPARDKDALVARFTEEKWGKLRAMRCWPEVEARLQTEFPVTMLVAWIQDDQEEYTHVTPESLRVMLLNYRKEVLIPKKREEVSLEPAPATTPTPATASIPEGVDEVAELGELYLEQKARFQEMRDMEKKLGFASPATGAAIRDMRATLLARAELKVKLGIVGPERPKTAEELEKEKKDEPLSEKYGAGAAEVIKDPMSRGRVISIFRQMSSLRKHDKEDVKEVMGELKAKK